MSRILTILFLVFCAVALISYLIQTFGPGVS